MNIKMQLVNSNHGQEINQLLQRLNLLEVVTIGIITHISSIKLSNYHINHNHFNCLKFNWCFVGL